MHPTEAKRILSALADGIDPSSGRVLMGYGPTSHPQVIRALFVAVNELGKLEKSLRPKQPSNAGKPWSQEEDTRLLEAFDAGMPIKELIEQHARSKGAIESRLMRHGRWRGNVPVERAAQRPAEEN